MRKCFLLTCLLMMTAIAAAKDKHKSKYETCSFNRVVLQASRLSPVMPCHSLWESAVNEDGGDHLSQPFGEGGSIIVFPPVDATCEGLERAFAEKEVSWSIPRPLWADEGGNSRWYKIGSNVIRSCIESRQGSFLVVFDDSYYASEAMVGAIVDEIISLGPPAPPDTSTKKNRPPRDLYLRWTQRTVHVPAAVADLDWTITHGTYKLSYGDTMSDFISATGADGKRMTFQLAAMTDDCEFAERHWNTIALTRPRSAPEALSTRWYLDKDDGRHFACVNAQGGAFILVIPFEGEEV